MRREIASKTFIQVLNIYFAVGKGLFYLPPHNLSTINNGGTKK
jgi:hypothetical protein